MEEFRARFHRQMQPGAFLLGQLRPGLHAILGTSRASSQGRHHRPAYSHEEISAGFWPGGGAVDGPAFYAYAAPSPEGLDAAPIQPEEAGWNREFGEFILMYDDVRRSEAPESKLMSFLESTYGQAARLGGWDRSLQRASGALHA